METVSSDHRSVSSDPVSDSLFRLLIATVKDYAIFMIDHQGSILSWNDGAERIKGYRAAEIIGRNFSCFYSAEDNALDLPRTELDEALRNGRLETSGWRLRKNGSGFWADIVITAIHGPDGELAGFAKITRDVTHRMVSERRFRNAMQYSAIGLGLISLEGSWLEANQALTRILGYSAEELSTLTFQNLTHPDDLEADLNSVAALLAGEIKSYQMEKRYIRKDGQLIWALLSVSLVHDEAERPLYFISQVQDIGERKEAERQRARLTERVSLATRAGRIGIYEWDIQSGRFIWDTRMYELNDLEPAGPDVPLESLGQVMHPDDVDRVRREFKAAIGGGAPFDTEFRVIWRNGDTHNIRSLAAVITDAAGIASRVVGTSWDITDLRVLSEQLLIAKENAEHANRAKSEFLTVMSHELRTPMNGVLGFAQLLDSAHFGPLNAKQKEFVAAVLHSGEHLLKLIDDILELSKIDAGRLTVSVEPVDLPPVMKSVIATLAGMADDKRVALFAGSFGDGLPPLLADRMRLAQVLLNLGSNAIKYNRPGGSVTLLYEEIDPDWARVSITDTGIGIPDDRKHELFQPFNRLDAAKMAIDGTGIGLALSSRLIGLMGGRIGFVSKEGVGSCFWIDLRIHRAS